MMEIDGIWSWSLTTEMFCFFPFPSAQMLGLKPLTRNRFEKDWREPEQKTGKEQGTLPLLPLMVLIWPYFGKCGHGSKPIKTHQNPSNDHRGIDIHLPAILMFYGKIHPKHPCLKQTRSVRMQETCHVWGRWFNVSWQLWKTRASRILRTSKPPWCSDMLRMDGWARRLFGFFGGPVDRNSMNWANKDTLVDWLIWGPIGDYENLE